MKTLQPKSRILINLFIILTMTCLYSQHTNADKFVGTWQTSFGTLKLVSNGAQVYGDYSDKGVIYGGISKKDGKYHLAGTFENYQQNKEGIFNFELPVKGKYKGKWVWRNSTNWMDWNGTKTSSARPDIKNFYRVIIHHYNHKKKIQPAQYNIAAKKNGLKQFWAYKLSEDSYEIYLPKGNFVLELIDNYTVKATANIVIEPKYPNQNNYYKVNIYE